MAMLYHIWWVYACGRGPFGEERRGFDVGTWDYVYMSWDGGIDGYGHAANKRGVIWCELGLCRREK